MASPSITTTVLHRHLLPLLLSLLALLTSRGSAKNPPPPFAGNYAVTGGWERVQYLDDQREVMLSMDKYGAGLLFLFELLESAPVSLTIITMITRSVNESGFDVNYVVNWGGDHASTIDSGRKIVLSMNNSSGSGFGSKLYYGSGFFHLNIKVPGRNSAGVVTAFYLHSASSQGWDELDFEFLGNLEGKPILLQTNVFTIGKGYREQRIKLWFDPTSSFHDYKILWNPYQIVFYVDEVPIRVFENKTSQGVSYPSKPMQIQASIWNGEDWATDGGRTKTNWSYAPFFANFRGFDIDGCRSDGSNDATCSSSSLWWNSARFRELNHDERLAYQNVKRNYMDYDYCADRKRHPTTPPECPQ